MASPPEKIDAIRQAANIVEVVGEHVRLRKSGRNFVGLCPFHPEKSPSFSVSQDKRLFYCFGCHVGGDVFAFLMRHQGLDFQTALRQVAQRVGIELEPLSPAQQEQARALTSLAAVNDAACSFFAQALLRPCGAPARNYLTARRLPAAFVKARRLGFGHSSALLLAHLQRQGHSPEAAARAGLLREDNRHHLFEGRLIFPIYNSAGQVAGFGARSLEQGGKGPKYINSRDSLLFSKRRLLYGLFEAQGAMRQRKRAIVVEGYMDVLAAQRSGMEETVAVMGTSLTAQHAATLKKCAPLAVVVLDADAAGRRAAQVSSAMLLQAGLQVAVGNLPAGEDPDSLLRSGGKARLQEVVDTAPAAMEYFLKEAFAAPPGSAPMSIEARAQAARSLQPLFGALPPGLEKDLYTARLAAQVGVSVEQLQRDLRRHSSVGRKPALPPEQAAPHAEAPRTAAVRPAQQAPKSVTPRPRPEHFELELLRELLLYPELRARFGELADFAISVPMQALLEELAAPAAEVEAVLRAHIDDARWLRSLLAVRPLPDADATYSLHTFEAVLARFKRQHVQAALQDLFAEMRALEARGEATDAHMRRKQELTARKRALYRSRSKRTVVKPSE